MAPRSQNSPVHIMNYTMFNPWWKDIVYHGVKSKQKRHINESNADDMVLLAKHAKAIRSKMRWKVYTDADVAAEQLEGLNLNN